MADKTGIQWTATVLPDGTSIPGATFNPWIGCARVSPGCAHCYAEELARTRMKLDVWDGKTAKYRHITSDNYWKTPLRWNRQAAESGIRRKVFCASMADVFEDRPAVAWHRERLWALIWATPHLDWLLLTKRIENVPDMVPDEWMEEGFPKNVWMGTSCENQYWFQWRIPKLMRLPVQVRFLSCEPLLGPIDMRAWLVRDPDDEPVYWATHHPQYEGPKQPLSWVIAGGESGAKHRPMKADWARDLRDQCLAADVPFFFKQWGGRTSKSGGDLLDGQQYHQFPAHCLQPSRP